VCITGDLGALPEVYEKLDVYLKSRCVGLLELHRHGSHDKSTDPGSWNRATSTVSYLHRTVKDFLATNTAQNLLSNTLGSAFDPRLSLIASYVLRMKMRVFICLDRRVQGLYNPQVQSSIIEAMKLARWISSEHNILCFKELDQLRDAAFHAWDFRVETLEDYQLLAKTTPQSQSDCDQRQRWNQNFLGEGITQGLS
jgi:hypothetical protein